MERKKIAALGLACAFALTLGFSLGRASAAGTEGVKAPARPKRERRKLDSATDLAKDFALVVDYLERGQAFYREYQRGTHSVEDNKEFLAFLEHYEKELAVAKKEVTTLEKWIKARGSLESIQ
ncbi:MAG: hypothetical protein AUJ52_00095 [Elusimicrobia bacterium CG1_02_63_36]|nr:MAG: hypothetical protein AUJ52_00095 [Elusimicrobia bacterium CG1_02_63_36]PIP83999.1 MAG: hypothetical protein COR54_06450 [Elusimicrobia bacterium CG22_combo_CG10-13_8_21_14_all_63_91]PJA13579.1 MAG: hypothetical protein COX66_14540 [Elusimicrobia bacterium CG_4_10_14_0_2_um_filter_63_34]PJB23947.1 MAG: hypothetical protein CO113_16265 [Elusimicrobia bacterium CG_4_9_14_3_um_filter_62_55]